ncbi:MBL fold metallo-hydrolase [Paeniroseomonas aquatica]|uniref:MBL fold metallo-hydrolase n=1 Tax=Paeniroseomonas aquatica TaxID=373043 RepID=A0ABT8A2U4_9PROT|nr:MBL fold metallo-hydrolase [Paeniroseomonas aquatica]MDN3564019.1 MBL fold metallo-hydrolase [Paeniroseomonas aquatica]
MALKAAIIPVTPFEQNCSLFWDDVTLRGVVIDPGGEVERILTAVAELKLGIEAILLTHGHMDHAGGAAELKAALPDAPPIIGPDRRDAFLLEGLEAQGAKYGITARNVTPDRWLAEGDAVSIAGEEFAVLHCPGHTPGHVVFVSEALRLAVVGDVVFRGSIGRTDFPYGDHAALLAAIHGKLLPLGDDISFLCGHGPGSTLGHERQRNPFLQG